METTDRILRATVHLVETSGFNGVTIRAVAAQAQVSRQTVYANFGTREALISQAMQGLAAQLASRVFGRIETIKPPDQYLIEFLVCGRSELLRQPALSQLILSRAASPMLESDLLATEAPSIVREVLGPLLERAPELAPQFDEVCEFVLRLFISVIMFDSDAVRSDDELRGFLRRRLIPAIGLLG